MIARGFIVAAIVVASTVAHAEDPKESAKKAIARAKDFHKAGKLPEALQELTIAYALDPQKDLLYGIAQIHVKLGQCPDAITFYRRYLAAKPDADAAAKAKQAIEACEKNPTRPPDVKPDPKPEVKPDPKPEVKPDPKPEVKPDPKPVTTTTSPWYTDVLGDALVGSGVIAGVVALVMYRSAVSTRESADDAATYPEFVDKLDDARTTRTYAIVAGAAGGALLVAGVIRFATRSTSKEQSRLTLVPSTRGGLVTWHARF